MVGILLAISTLSVALKLPYVLSPAVMSWGERKPMRWFQRLVFLSLNHFAQLWHDYKIHNEDNLLYTFCRLQPRLIASYLLFKIPLVKEIFHTFGVLPSKEGRNVKEVKEAFVHNLSQSDYPIMLVPGGVHDCLKRYHERHQVNWPEFPGYCRLLEQHIETWPTKDIAVVPFYTKNCEECYWITPTWYDYSGPICQSFYNQLKNGNILILPFLMTMVLASIGNMILPQQVPLDTVFGEPIYWQPGETGQVFNQHVVAALQKLIDESEKKEFVRSSRSLFTRWIILPLLGMFTAFQNIIILILFLSAIWSLFPPLLVYVIANKMQSLLGFKKDKHFQPAEEELQKGVVYQ